MPDHSKTCALITGGTQGLGYAIAERLVKDGCRRVALVGRDPTKGAKAVRTLQTHASDANVQFISTDLADAIAVSSIMAQAIELLGATPNALVNSAADTSRAPFGEITAAHFDRTMAINARAPLMLTQSFARSQNGGHAKVVNIGSIAAHCGPSNLTPYNASKAALVCITKSLAHTLRGKVRVNCINVGWMDTPAENVVQRHEGAPADWLEIAESKQPFGMLVKPVHLAHQVGLLLSDDSGVVTGAVMDWDQHVIGDQQYK